VSIAARNTTYGSDFYTKPLRYQIDVLSPDESQIYYHSDGFDPTQSSLVVEKISVNQNQWETWDASISIDDSIYNNLDTDKLDNGAVLKIRFGKTPDTLVNAFYGIIDLIGPTIGQYNSIKYDVVAKGFGVVPNYTFVNFQKIPPPSSLSENALISDPTSIPFYANNLMRALFGDLNIMPLLDYTVSERMGSNFTLDFISDAVTNFIPGIKQPLVTASQVANLIAKMSGSIWYLDEYKRLQFRYPYGQNSGIVIKDYEEVTDDGNYISYVVGGNLTYKDSTRSEDGFAQRLYAIAEKTDVISKQAKALNFTTLLNKDLAFAVIPGPAKLSNMTFIMSKTGAGTNALNPLIERVKGYVVPDNNHSPGDKAVASFYINLSDIPENPAPIVKIDRPSFKSLEIDKLYWIVMKERGSAENNTVRVWHDDDAITASTPARPRYAAQRTLPNGGDTIDYRSDGWFVSATGPEYAVAFATLENILVEASDDTSIQKWSPGRPVEARVDNQGLKTFDSTLKYLNLVVQQTAQKIRNYENLTVTIPNNLIQAGENVQVASQRFKQLAFENNVMASVKSVNYSLDVTEWGVGTRSCSVVLKGYVSPV
jgi:hypothetical protein